ncbi:MAG: hypothetical protein EP329_24650 [Deltaproteobacteria bacterium]|nr:MAG: hypothetical protein EP329_24650 [Deltaproteobacteria bacterium]
MAFACTAGDGADTRLYLSNLEVDCGGGDVTTIDPTLGPGTLARLGTTDVPNTHIFEAMVTRGAEQLGTWNKMYWNVALGLADVTGCTFNAEGTASDGLFADGATPADGTWPYLSWSGPLDTCTHHGLDSGDGVVETLYARPPGISFAASFDGLAAAPFVFDIPIAGALTALDPGRYADGSYAVSCFDYKNPVAPYVYAGATGDGVYTIDLDGAAGGYAPMDVYCDMTTDGGGWTEITACQARNDLNGTMVAVQVGTGSGFDAATCSPYAQDQAGVHTYHYTFDFPPGFGEFYLNGYTVKAKSPSSSYTSEIGPAQFTMTTWTAANNAAYGDVGFGDAAASGPTITYSQTLSATVMCTSCTIPWPQDGTVYTVATGPATQFRVGWGEGGGEYEGWYAWWAGTVRLR